MGSKHSSLSMWVGLIGVLFVFGCDNEQGDIEILSQGIRYLTVSSEGWGFIDSRGEQVIPPDYTLVLPFAGEWAVVGLPLTDDMDPDSTLERRAIVNKSGEVVWGPETVEWCKTYMPGVYLVNDGEQIKSVYVDNATDCIIADGIEDCGRYERRGEFLNGLKIDFNEDLIPVMKNGKWGYAAPDGEIVIACQYAEAPAFSAGVSVASVKTMDGKRIIIDTQGNPTTDQAFRGLSIFSEGVAFAIDDEDNYYLVDTKGRPINSHKFYDMTLMSSGRITAQDIQTGKWGIYDAQLNEVLTPDTYESMGSFSHGLASCIDDEDKLAGYLDQDGKLVIKLDWNGSSHVFLRPFNGDLAYVTMNGITGYINRRGQWVWDDDQP